MTIADTQTVTTDTIVGPKTYNAPAGWAFDNTLRVSVWLALRSNVREEVRRGRHVSPRSHEALERRARIQCLANLLANDLGKSLSYWLDEADRIVRAEIEALGH
jgi:hypothetical protein